MKVAEGTLYSRAQSEVGNILLLEFICHYSMDQLAISCRAVHLASIATRFWNRLLFPFFPTITNSKLLVSFCLVARNYKHLHPSH